MWQATLLLFDHVVTVFCCMSKTYGSTMEMMVVEELTTSRPLLSQLKAMILALLYSAHLMLLFLSVALSVMS